MNKLAFAVTGAVLALGLTACSGPAGSPGGGASSGGGSASHAASDAGTGSDGSPAAGGSTSSGSGEKKTIVFSTFFPDARFQEAKKKYEALHPNIEIRLTDVDTEDSRMEAAEEKYITDTNAAMLAGKGPDLVQMDVLSADEYVKHHLLADMGDLMAQDSSFRKEDYFANVLDNVRIGDHQYVMPLSFFLEGLAGDEEAIRKSGVKVDDRTWSWDDFAKTAKQLSAEGDYPSALVFGGPEYLLAEMAQDNYSLFVDEENRKAKFDSAPFVELMKQTKTLFDDGVVTSSGQKQAYFYSVQINSPWDYLVSLRERGEHQRLYVKPHAKELGEGGFFRAYRSVAISASSKVKPEAWDFVKFLMSDAIETPPTTAGFPINKNAFAKQLQQLRKQSTVKTYEEGPMHGQAIPVDTAMLDQLPDFVNGAVHPYAFQSDTLRDLIRDESVAYFRGQKSAEAVAKLIQNKATTYLNE